MTDYRKRDPERIRKMRIAIRHLIDNDKVVPGMQMRLAEQFGVTRQRISQIFHEERDKPKSHE